MADSNIFDFMSCPSVKLFTSKSADLPRQDLPIHAYRDRILEALKDNQFVIVEAETGSGKSTQIPQYLLDSGYRGIVCSQPRRLAATSLAQRVAKEVECRVGGKVGYRVRFDKAVSCDTILSYVSDGVLLRELTSNKHAEGYSVVMIDEAHQRSAATDSLMALLKRICLMHRPDLKVIVTSATLEVEKFAKYFPGAATINVPGKLFPVEVIYEPSSSIVEIVLRIHNSRKPGDILIFLPGLKAIEDTCDSLGRSLPSDTTIILPLHSYIPDDEQSEIFVPTQAGCRKIICATNIAETSLTIEGIVYVIDKGLVKQNTYDFFAQNRQIEELQVSKQEADQRKGRAGRLQPGICYRLYSEQTYNDMKTAPTPEIARCDSTPYFLYLKTLGILNASDLDFIDPPSPELVRVSEEQLQQLGAVNADGSLTERGKKISRLSVDPHLASALVTASELNCLKPVIRIVAMLSPKNRLERKGFDQEHFRDSTGEHLTLLNIYTEWIKSGFGDFWCKLNKINPSVIKQASQIQEDLESTMRELNYDVQSNDEQNILRSFINPSRSNVARRDPKLDPKTQHIKYRITGSGREVYLHSSNALAPDPPTEIVFLETQRCYRRTFMQKCSKIEP